MSESEILHNMESWFNGFTSSEPDGSYERGLSNGAQCAIRMLKLLIGENVNALP